MREDLTLWQTVKALTELCFGDALIKKRKWAEEVFFYGRIQADLHCVSCHESVTRQEMDEGYSLGNVLKRRML